MANKVTMFKVFIEAVFFNYGLKAFAIRVAIAVDIADNKKRLERIKRPACSRLGFGRLCSKKKAYYAFSSAHIF